MTSNSNFARSPLMDNVLNFVPEGHEKALKQAMYNAVGIVIVGIGAGALTAVYFVLQPFLRPLLWALFFGSVLYPVKRRFNNFVHRWVKDLRKSNTPFAVGLVLLPVGVFDGLANIAVNSVSRHWKLSTAVTVILVAPYCLYSYTPKFLITVTVVFKDIIFFFLTNVLAVSPYILWTLAIGFIFTVVFYWKSDTKQGLRYASLIIWALLFLNFSTVFGSLAAIVAIGLFAVGIGVEVNDALTQINNQVTSDDATVEFQSPIRTAWSVLCNNGTIPSPSNAAPVLRNKVVVDAIPTIKGHYGLIPAPQVAPAKNPYPKYFPWADRRFFEKLLGMQTVKEKVGEITAAPVPPASRRHSSLVRQDSFSSFLSTDTESKLSDVYMYILFWACFLVLIFRTFSWTWPLILVSLIYLVTKKLGSHFGIWTLLWSKMVDGSKIGFEKLGDRQEVLFPPPVRGLCKLLIRGDSWISSLLDNITDILTTMGSILFVLVFVILALIFLLLQIHAESMHLLQVTSNLINSSVVHNEVVQGMLPDGISDVIDSMYDNAYEYGREWAVKMVRHMIPEEDEEKSIAIEIQVLELWDRVYSTWMTSSADTDSQLSANGSKGFGSLFSELSSSPELFNLNAIVAFIKENVDTFVAVIQASWSVLKGNISLALSAVTATLSIVFGGGSALLNFLFNLIVFLTALFYLLAGSGRQYSPIVFLSKIAPGGMGNKFAHAVEEAINGVFTASLKMAVFYGLWTWLIHKIFQVKMVYIPSVLAAIFGAVPFLGTYWAVLPAVMELWLVQNNWILSIVMVIFQILPMSCVDTAIYSEIQGGGHPYLTGLSVAGGIFCLGAEGAIVGPLILCCFFVVINMSSSMMNESPLSTPGKKLPFRQNFLSKRTTSIM